MEERIFKDLDQVCRDMMSCLQSTQRMVDDKRISRLEVAEQLSSMVVDMGTLLLELQRSSAALDGEPDRLQTIARLTSSCKTLEGTLKEIRNDLNAGSALSGEQKSDRQSDTEDPPAERRA